MNEPSVEYGRARSGEIARYCQIDAEAFCDADNKTWRWIERLGEDCIRIVRLGDEVAGGLMLLDDAQQFGGRAVHSWAIADVAVCPAYRGLRVGRALVMGMLHEARSAGVALSVLMASTPTFYRSMGYEPAGWYVKWGVNPRHFPSVQHGLSARPMQPSDHEAVGAVYAKCIEQCAGPLLRRSAFFWQRCHEPLLGRHYGYVFERQGKIVAYVMVERDRHDEALHVVDAAAIDQAGWSAIGSMLRGYGSVNRLVTWSGGLNDPLCHLIAENSARVKASPEEWLMRLVDVDAALSQRGYAPVHCELHLEVRDEALAENAGRRVLVVRDGRPTVQPGGSGRIACDVRGLTALYTGHATATELALWGLMSGPAEDLALTTLAFSGPRPFMQDKF